MSYQARVYPVMVASPSDVRAEREIARDVIYEWNIHQSRIHKLVLLPVMWETHSVPEYGERPQAILNRQLLAECDMLVAIFWTRLGTPTGAAQSGTVEEIEKFAESGKPVLIYFCEREFRRSEASLDELQRLEIFQKKAETMGLVARFATPDSFKELLRQHLLGKLREIGALGPSGVSTDGTKLRPESIPQESPAANKKRRVLRQLLAEAHANEEVLRADRWSNAPALLTDAYTTCQQASVNLPIELADLIDRVYSAIRHSKSIHESIKATPGNTRPELMQIYHLHDQVRRALPDLIQCLDSELASLPKKT